MGIKLVFGKRWISVVFTTQFGATTLGHGYHDVHKNWRFASLIRNSLGWQFVFHSWDGNKQKEVVHI